MNDTPAEHDPELDSIPSPGAALAEAREKKRLTTREVADQLNLRVDVVEALERDDYSDLPGKTYVRGYIRSYARLLDVDEEDVLDSPQYSDPVPVSRRKVHMHRYRPRVRRSSGGGKSRVVWLFLGLAVLIVVTWTLSDVPGVDPAKWFAGLGGDDAPAPADTAISSGQLPLQVNVTRLDASSPQRSAAPAGTMEDDSAFAPAAAPVAASAGAPETATGPVSGADTARVEAAGAATAGPEAIAGADTGAPAAADSIALTAAPAEAPAASVALTASPAQAAPATPSSGSDSPVPAEGSLIFSVSAESWVEVRDAADRRLVYKTLPANEISQLTGTPPFRVVIGKPESVKLQLNGQAIDYSAFIRPGKPSRFQIGADGMLTN